MKANLLDLFRQATGSNFYDQLSKYLNEEKTDVKKAMAIIVPAVLSAFVKKTSSENQAELVLHFIQYYANAHFSLPIESEDHVHELIRLGGVVLNNISFVELPQGPQREVSPGAAVPASKLRTESVEALIQITGCVFKELIFREVLDYDMGAEDLRAWLQSQNDNVLKAQKEAEQMFFSGMPGSLFETEREAGGSEFEPKNETIDLRSNAPFNEALPLKTYRVVRLLIISIVSMILLYFLLTESSSVENPIAPDSSKFQDPVRDDIPVLSPQENDSIPQ